MVLRRWSLVVVLLVSASAFYAPASQVRQTRVVLPGVKLDPELDATTRKWGLEGGLFSIFKSDGDDKGAKAKELLKEYGVAYLATSITLALISFTLCYFLVDAGVDVASLLAKVNIDVTGATEKAGTVAIAYAFHKAASPIRFPPTVALTPIVAKLLKAKKDESELGA